MCTYMYVSAYSSICHTNNIQMSGKKIVFFAFICRIKNAKLSIKSERLRHINAAWGTGRGRGPK